MQDVAAINRAGCDHRMVALAKSTPSSRATMSYQAKSATVMLGSGLIKLDPQPDGGQFDHRQEVA